ncbi:glycerate dehydrogenase [Agrobacterium tumefaciens]|uniref:2-hydroxyacid dehydrogenase n=1 Tax=Agrobacterium fabrum (strain C58 / ATCC 33970) TaxID=176299 RepID=Q7D3C1_AGRFC|nr:D-2-hydroxyacid dehydrogenase [Agrobacterium fabrum]KEY50039.1 glycerate dehydrogenase [Agrobacterium tumefaciens]AAK90707.2 2-hydroxyacid dehydrogenase [Agrobacterium fabrum str. C58]MCX2878433.1 D-2-hydroxyacid dehydrogenase [Agrobacterium fabrum]NMV72980.1 D-2-hydroxyacid dehydrogenase [Agrobacterium fabrum]QQN09380.1 D-2-hydroxyacid dehydrogenase [Agrobacterium fabrum]
MSDAASKPLRVVLLDRKTLPDDIRFRAFSFANELVAFDQTAPDEVSERIKDADIVITNKAPVRGPAIASAPRLKLVAVAATGTDVVDVAACAQRGVAVSNIRNYAVNTVPEHTFAMILALRRSLLGYRKSVKAGRWQEVNQFCYFDFPINDLAGSTLGIIGDGALGRSVADLGRAFGMKVLFSDYKGTKGMGPLYTPFEKVLEASDVITLHSPLMSSTRNMISTAEFAQMTKRPLLINTARGGLVDEAALEVALRSGQISGAGFDVVTTEPPAADHPLMRLLDLPNFILTPHVAWASREAVQSLVDQLIDNVEAFERGARTNIVAA